MLQWRPRLFALIAVLALLVIAIVGGYGEDIMFNLYW
jgi:nitrate reductase NapE component